MVPVVWLLLEVPPVVSSALTAPVEWHAFHNFPGLDSTPENDSDIVNMTLSQAFFHGSLFLQSWLLT